MNSLIEREYKDLLKQNLGEIPQPETIIYDLNDLPNIQLSENDRKVFSLLYPIKPTTNSGRQNNNTIGNGELAIYWLFSYNKVLYHVVSNSKTSSKLPDLTINGTGIEIKAYEDSPYINLGRISKTKNKDVLEMLNISYTLSTIKEYDSKDKRVYYSTLSINPKQLDQIFENVCEVKNNVHKWQDKIYGKNIQFAIARLEYIYKAKNKGQEFPNDKKKLTEFLISDLVKTKLKEKPKLGGYIINTHSDGTLHSQKITEDFLDSSQFHENCVKHATSQQGSVIINLNKLFG